MHFKYKLWYIPRYVEEGKINPHPQSWGIKRTRKPYRSSIPSEVRKLFVSSTIREIGGVVALGLIVFFNILHNCLGFFSLLIRSCLMYEFLECLIKWTALFRHNLY